MKYAGILIVLGLLLAVGSCGEKHGDMDGLRQPETRPGTDGPGQAHAMRVPPGFKAKNGTTPEPYSKTGWAKEIVHEKSGIEMVFIPAGEFMMGCPAEESKWPPDQGPGAPRADHEAVLHGDV